MKRLKEVFKFNIDDEVKGKKFYETEQVKLRVVFCEIELCPGGARLLYHCRTVSDGGISTDLTRLAEHEIEACGLVEGIKAEKTVEEIKADKKKIEDVFKFKIGSTVKANQSIGPCHAMFEVVSCWAEKCMGVDGEVEQFHYNCRNHFVEGIGVRTIRFNEHELEECDFEEELREQTEIVMEKQRVNEVELRKMQMEVRKKYKEKSNYCFTRKDNQFVWIDLKTFDDYPIETWNAYAKSKEDALQIIKEKFGANGEKEVDEES